MSPHHPFTGLQDPCLCHCLSTGAVWLLFVAISCPALLRCSSLRHLLCPNLMLVLWKKWAFPAALAGCALLALQSEAKTWLDSGCKSDLLQLVPLKRENPPLSAKGKY